MAPLKKRGRPSLGHGPSTEVHLRVPESLYDRTYAAAIKGRMSVPERIRRALKRDLGTENRQPET